MNIENLSLEPIKDKKISILGYGNQGRVHALNLRDSGLNVIIGLREGKSSKLAKEDGFSPIDFKKAAELGDIVMFLLPDQVIGSIYSECTDGLKKNKIIGFCHGFAFTFKQIDIFNSSSYILVSPKGAGAILRNEFTKGRGLPGVFAVYPKSSTKARDIALSYAKGTGIGYKYLFETTFEEETYCDLFGEQAVLCGGILKLMENAFEVLVNNGFSKEMAFFECCYEVKLIIDLWLKFGPYGISEKISPTAFYGGLTRGKMLIDERIRKKLEDIFIEIKNGKFATEWLNEVKNGMLKSKVEKTRLKSSLLENVFEKLSTFL